MTDTTSPWANGEEAAAAAATQADDGDSPAASVTIELLDYNPFNDEQTRHRIAQDIADALNARSAEILAIRGVPVGQLSPLFLEALTVAVGGVIGTVYEGCGEYDKRTGSLIAAGDAIIVGVNAMTQASIRMTSDGCPDVPEVVAAKAALLAEFDKIKAALETRRDELLGGASNG